MDRDVAVQELREAFEEVKKELAENPQTGPGALLSTIPHILSMCVGEATVDTAAVPIYRVRVAIGVLAIVREYFRSINDGEAYWKGDLVTLESLNALTNHHYADALLAVKAALDESGENIFEMFFKLGGTPLNLRTDLRFVDEPDKSKDLPFDDDFPYFTPFDVNAADLVSRMTRVVNELMTIRLQTLEGLTGEERADRSKNNFIEIASTMLLLGKLVLSYWTDLEQLQLLQELGAMCVDLRHKETNELVRILETAVRKASGTNFVN